MMLEILNGDARCLAAWSTRCGVESKHFRHPLFVSHQSASNCSRLAAPCAVRDREGRPSNRLDSVGPAPPLITRLLATISSADIAEQERAARTTLYTLWLTTSQLRGSALSEPNSAVNVCLIGRDSGGTAILHHIGPVDDVAETTTSARRMEATWRQAVLEAGSNASGSLAPIPAPDASTSSLAATAASQQQHKRRFQEGSVDCVSFLAPELSVSHLLVGTEGGTWRLQEARLHSARTDNTERFVCRQVLGQAAGEGAALLLAAPPGTVVVGQGDSARLLTQAEAVALRRSDLDKYEQLKVQLVVRSLAFAAGGTVVATLAGGSGAGWPFAVGGLAGVVYQLLLQQSVDTIVGHDSTATGMAGLQPQASGPVVPLALRVALVLAILSVGAVAVMRAGLVSSWTDVDVHMDAWQLIVGLLGFSSYKLATISVMAAGSGRDEDSRRDD